VGSLRSSFRARQRVPWTLVRTFLSNERFSRTFLCPRTLSLPANTTCSTFLAPDGFSTSLVHLWLLPLSSDLISEMVCLFPTNFYYDSSCPVTSRTSSHAYVNPRMRTISLCVMGSPYAKFSAIPARLHTGIPICIRRSPYAKSCIWGYKTKFPICAQLHYAYGE
jgi:hypothetical protein